MKVLEVKEMDTFYGLSHILFRVSLEVDEGETVCILGRNGVGKTTTLRSIMNLTPPRSGSLKFCGEEIVGKQPFEIAHYLSHWTWLPPLRKQFIKSDRRFLSLGNQCIIRLMTPLRMRYEEAYIKACPFNKIINGMMSPQMIEDTVEIMLAAIDQGVHIDVVINNRAGGNAPIIAQKISETFLQVHSKGQQAH